MRSGIVVLALVAVIGSGACYGKDRTGPDILRGKHAGMASFTSAESVSSLYPKLFQATVACYEGEVAPGAGTGTNGGALGAMSSAGRRIGGDLAADGSSAWIVVRATGFFGAVDSGFLQIDLVQTDGASRVDVFHKNNVKGQREFISEVEHWLQGEMDHCHKQPFIRKQKPSE